MLLLSAAAQYGGGGSPLSSLPAGQRDAAPMLCSRTRSCSLANWCAGLHNPPGMALPCCPPFAQGGLFFAPRHTTDLGQSFSMAGCVHSGKDGSLVQRELSANAD